MKDTECLRGLMGKYALREKWKEGRVHIERVGGVSVLAVMLINKFSVLHSIDREGRGLCLIGRKRKGTG